MELILRCTLADRPGALAALATAVSQVGGDIQAVDVVETADGTAVDDLVVVLEPNAVKALIERLEAEPDVRLVHVGPSRGHPGGAVARFALVFESLVNGAMTVEHAVTTLIGGTMRAERATMVDASDAPAPREGLYLFPFDHRMLVVERAYRLTDTERERAEAVLRACRQVASLRASTVAG